MHGRPDSVLTSPYKEPFAMRHLVLSLLVLTIPVLSHADVDLSAGSATEPVGATFAIPVSISNVTDLFAFQFDLSFDPSIVQLQSITEGPFLPTAGTTFFLPGTIDNTAGTATFTADALIGPISGVSGSGVLADFNFEALSEGTSNLTLSNAILVDSSGGLISFTPQSGQATIAGRTLPEPTFFPLLGGIGMVLCGCLVIKRRRQQA